MDSIREIGVEHIPQELRSRPRWVAWTLADRDGRATKIPVNPAGGRADTTDPATWGGFREAVKAARFRSGVGFVFADSDPYFGIDLDRCRDAESGEIEPWATAILERFGTYAEASPSGTGIHIIGRGTLPPGRRRTGRIECYDRGRFFTVTAHVIPGFETIQDCGDILATWHGETFPAQESTASRPPPVQGQIDDDTILDRCRSSRNRQKFESLWRGETGGHGGDDSAADLALLSLLGFWTQDFGQLDRLFRVSGLYREKWERPDYRERTISKALERGEFYNPASLLPGERVCFEFRRGTLVPR